MCLNPGNASRDGQSISVVVSDATRLPEVGLFDLASQKVRILATLNDVLMKDISISAPAEFSAEAEDGSKVHGWVIRTSGAGCHPAILEVHGGPHGQYGWAFFHEFQVLAAAGYTVVYSNPRGSKGYGEAHCAAIKGAWGKKDWMDVQAVLEWMKAQPDIDASHIGIMGGSYGGYMTNWAVGHSREFKAAITDRCVSNLVTQGMTSDFPFQPDSYWPGIPWSSLENIAELWRQSPIAYFDQVETPMLIIHSEGDLRCNIGQSEAVFTALQQRGIESRFVRYPQSTFHGLSRSGPPDLRIHRLHEILNWWKKHLEEND
jgi:dipeptidyl aminopeptidase/acylaminoacyl peptidase